METISSYPIHVPALNEGYACDLWVPNQVRDFVDKIPSGRNMSIYMGLCDSDYYRMHDEMKLGPSGWSGCRGNTGVSNQPSPPRPPRKPYSERVLMMNINFTADRSWIEKQKPEFSKMVLTFGGRGNTYPVFGASYTSTPVIHTYGIYKSPLFDKVYPHMKEAGVVEDEMDLAKYNTEYDAYNQDFVESREWNGPVGCISEYTHSTFVETDTALVSIGVLAVDVAQNADLLLSILKTL